MPRTPALVLLAAILAGACAPKGLQLPSGEGEAFPDYAQAWDEAAATCRGVVSLSAELAISGRAGGQKLRGRVLAGFAAPDRVRLEAVAPFGSPVFILVAGGRTSTLLLPRERQVLSGEPAAAILEALVGLPLGPDDLLAILAGCVSRSPDATGGRRYATGWARVDLADGSAAYLRREPRRWRIRAGVRPGLLVEYGAAGGLLPSTVRMQVVAAEGAPASDVRVSLSQVDIGGTLGPEVFTVKVPADAVTITLAELRRAGLIGDRR